MMIRGLCILLIFVFSVQGLALPKNTINLYLSQQISREEIVSDVTSDPKTFEAKVLQLKSQVENLDAQGMLDDALKFKIYQLERAITTAAINYNSHSSPSVPLKLGGAVIGTMVGALAARQMTRGMDEGGDIGSMIGLAFQGIALIAGVGGGALVGYVVTDLGLSRADLNANIKFLQ